MGRALLLLLALWVTPAGAQPTGNNTAPAGGGSPGTDAITVLPPLGFPIAMQSAAVANGNGTVLPITTYPIAIVDAVCSVACAGGTTINFEGTDSTGTFFAIQGVPLAGGAGVTTATAGGQWVFNTAGLVSIRARISAYSAGTITVTGNQAFGSPATGGGPITLGAGSAAIGSVFGPTAVGSANANPPVVIGGTATGAAGANVQGLSIVATSVAPVTATNTAVVVGLRPDSPGIVTLGQTTKSASVPVAIASDQLGGAAPANSVPIVLSSQYPVNSVTTTPTAVTATTTGTTAATAASLGATASVTNYVCGFTITADATALATGTATLSGTISGSLNYLQTIVAVTSGTSQLSQNFSPCIPASAANTAITITSAAAGTGGNTIVNIWGYRL